MAIHTATDLWLHFCSLS